MARDGRRFLYVFDPLCGWCFGAIPAMRRLRAERPDLPIDVLAGGLVTGRRVGPYAEMAGYIRSAAPRMTAVTGQAVSERFFELVERGGVWSSSAPPSWVVASVRDRDPERALELAHRVQEMHFIEGRDLNDPATYEAVAAELQISLPPLDGLERITEDEPRVAADFARARALGADSFPTFLVLGPTGAVEATLPTEYDPARFVALVDAAAPR